MIFYETFVPLGVLICGKIDWPQTTATSQTRQQKPWDFWYLEQATEHVNKSESCTLTVTEMGDFFLADKSGIRNPDSVRHAKRYN